ncbi:MAG TPA: TrkH family potassium uptake protein, partial [Bacteroidetes bacterium]|nr:TrkH family potassium uptake protein [Bacteroidota bacterium]
ELVGFALLSIGFWWEGFGVRRALYEGFFHAISAFCNAGFSTFDESLINSNALVKYTVAVLIIMGGLGYFVIYETMERYKSGRRFSLHSKVVLVTSGFLVVAGMFLLYLFEQGSVSITDCFFQSVTTRTAGFNSVDLTEINYAGIFLLTILMFIGASPGSTGGGIKTTTFFVIVVSIFSVLKGRTSVVVFKRSIPLKMILKSFATALVYIAIIAIGAILLLQDERIEFESAIFEVVSAMGTVGLSLGVTPQLSESGKIVIILLMFIGRLGPASFALATLTKQKELKIKYPEGTLY